MSYEQPARHQRIKLEPAAIIQRLETLVESAEIVESSIRDLILDVQMADQVLEKCQYAVSLSRRQSACLQRAIKSAEGLGER